jgi:Holliday junction resolvasome RuvABC endonuclease subunit
VTTTSAIILGFDPGIASPGVALIARKPAGGYRLIEHRVIRTTNTKSRQLSLIDRYNMIADGLSELIVRHKPTEAAIEEQSGVQAGAFKSGEFNASNSKTMVVVGAALAVCRVYRVPVFMIRPQRAKIAVCGPKSSKAEKPEVQAAVSRLIGQEIPQDASDAVAQAVARFQERR